LQFKYNYYNNKYTYIRTHTHTHIYIYIYMLYYVCRNLFNRLNICILALLLHMYDITSHLYFLLNISLKMAEYTEICSSCTTCLCVIVFNYCAFVRRSRDYFLLEGNEITAICLNPLKIPTDLLVLLFLNLNCSRNLR
jgi:hypothetical protein